MNILAIDTSHPTGSVAIRLGDGSSTTEHFGTASSHLVELGQAVATLLETTGAELSDIERVALVCGPGSFTGLRIGMSYVKGLFAVLGVGVVTLTSLELLAMQAGTRHDWVCPIIDARKSEVYVAVYRKIGLRSVGGEVVVPKLTVDMGARAAAPRQFLASRPIRRMLFIGSGAERFRTSIDKVFGDNASFAGSGKNQPSTELLCRVGEGLAPLSKEEILKLEPFYIRPSDAKLRPLKRMKT